MHYIDVGQADCALLECDGKYMVIDGGNVEDSSLVVSYLRNVGVEELEAVVCSHAHEDHVGGLAGSIRRNPTNGEDGVMSAFPVKAVYSPTRTYSSNCFDDFVYYAGQQDLTIQIPKPGDTFSLGSATVTILGPVDSYSETNNTSIVLRVQYGNTRFLFTGDMETRAENDMLDMGMDVKADVLKVGHHGSSTSTGYRFLRAVAPKYGVISVGANNQYGHPDADPLSRLNDADVTVYRTDKLGHIVAVSDGTNITFSWGKTTAQPTVPSGSGSSGSGNTGNTDTPPETEATEPAIDVPEAEYYVGNKNSKKLHLPTCKSLPAPANQVIFETWEEAVAEGYTFCKNCIA